jgi:phosphohistidine phosphatase
MYLYLIRHGIAIDPDPLALDSIADDESRPLTKIGRKKIAQVADCLKQRRSQKRARLGLTFDLMISSPLIRAKQTADIFIDKQISPKLEISQDLKPMGNLPAWLMDWNARSDRNSISTLAVVGHEPNLSEWAELLVFGKVSHQLMLKKGGMIGLKFPGSQIEIGTAQLYCLIPPKYLS